MSGALDEEDDLELLQAAKRTRLDLEVLVACHLEADRRRRLLLLSAAQLGVIHMRQMMMAADVLQSLSDEQAAAFQAGLLKLSMSGGAPILHVGGCTLGLLRMKST